MSNQFVNTTGLPFCKGCGHNLVTTAAGKALIMAGFSSPLEVILVTDIGCIGIIDKQFHTHTVHGLHGRSAALAMGISLGLENPRKKVLVFLGDGGATIGFQHIVEAAQKNVNMTLIVHNNMLYGMTGGQPSGLTPRSFKTAIELPTQAPKAYDLCMLIQAIGAPYVRRVLAASGDLAEVLAEALLVKGFSFLEVIEICPSYGLKRNPGKKIVDILAEAGIELVSFTNPPRPIFSPTANPNTASLFDGEPIYSPEFQSNLRERISLVLSGSAGEGVQQAAKIFAQAAIRSGLFATSKSNYPVTVGVGFSASELVLAPMRIRYTGISEPDVVLVTSEDGLEHRRASIEKMKGGQLFIDSSLPVPNTGAQVFQGDFRGRSSPKSATLFALSHFLKQRGIFPVQALTSSIEQSHLAGKIDLGLLGAV